MPNRYRDQRTGKFISPLRALLQAHPDFANAIVDYSEDRRDFRPAGNYGDYSTASWNTANGPGRLALSIAERMEMVPAYLTLMAQDARYHPVDQREVAGSYMVQFRGDDEIYHRQIVERDELFSLARLEARRPLSHITVNEMVASFLVSELSVVPDIAHYVDTLIERCENVEGLDPWRHHPDYPRQARRLAGETEITDCKQCHLFRPTTEMELGYGGALYCGTCFNRLPVCAECEIRIARYEMLTIGNQRFCYRCYQRLPRCSVCDGRYCEEDASQHEHLEQCVCEPHEPHFTFPVHDGMVKQNQIVDVQLPKGQIGDAGMRRIADRLSMSCSLYNWGDLLNNVGPEWAGKTGNFTRRVSRAAYKEFGAKLGPNVLADIGTLARDHTSDETDYRISFSRDLNLSPYEWNYDESCWWLSWSSSRCAMKAAGGLGIRFYHPNAEVGYARAWILPLTKDLQPTHDTMKPHSYLMFNAYGIDYYAAARVIAHITERTYRKIPRVDIGKCFINNGNGYLISDIETCQTTEAIIIKEDRMFADHTILRRAA